MAHVNETHDYTGQSTCLYQAIRNDSAFDLI